MRATPSQTTNQTQNQSAGEWIRRVCAWYKEHKRTLPWRDTRDPYRIWVSEIMLQQTRVEAVKPYYERFLQALPDVQSLAACPEDKLLKLWEGLGYYSRVRNLQKAAQVLTAQTGSTTETDTQKKQQASRRKVADNKSKGGRRGFPHAAEELQKLPGIGPYTAGAIASLAFNEPVPAADGNVFRILARITGEERSIDRPDVKKEMTETLAAAMREYWGSAGEDTTCKSKPGKGKATLRARDRSGRAPQNAEEAAFIPGDFNQGLMDLGATICLPNATPRCESCPLAMLCKAHAAGRELDFPVREKKKARRIEERTVLLIRDGQRVAIRKRPGKGLLAGLYEFPSLEAPSGADDAKSIRRHIQGYVCAAGLEPLRITRITDAKHIFSHVEWHMTGYEVRVAALDEAAKTDWILAEIGQIEREYPMPAAFAAYADYLQLRLGAR